jgi:hypothetical protein
MGDKNETIVDVGSESKSCDVRILGRFRTIISLQSQLELRNTTRFPELDLHCREVLHDVSVTSHSHINLHARARERESAFMIKKQVVVEREAEDITYEAFLLQQQGYEHYATLGNKVYMKRGKKTVVLIDTPQK